MLLMLLAVAMTAKGQVAVDRWGDDGTRVVRSAQEVMYDDFFHTARFAVIATADASGLVNFAMEVTFDEGLLDVSRGDTLALTLRGGERVILTTDRDLTRADIVKRHYRTYNDYYVTCHYPLTAHDIYRLSNVKATKMTVQTGALKFDRKLDRFNERFSRQFAAVYHYLM